MKKNTPQKKNENHESSGGTRTFPITSERYASIRNMLQTVYSALEEKGYDPVSQIVGYILSEDPAYITSFMNARGLITKYDRDELLEALVHFYFWANRES